LNKITKNVLSIEQAKKIAALAISVAHGKRLKVAIAIVDDGGRLLYFERMDDVSWGSGEVALAKAQSAAAYQRDTSVFDERLTGGRMAVLQQPFAFPIQGGISLEIDQQCVGGIGASGALAQEDTEICKAAAALLSNNS
jgi:glc operon protein GlcG